MTTYESWGESRGFAEPAAAARAAMRVTPTRNHIDNRFPVLGFTVDSGGRPFFEVLLATDRALFDPANASRRTSANFYASREHSGLIRAGNEPQVYLVPAAVLQRLGPAREMFYTAAAYESAQGQDAAYAIPPGLLATSAPSVGIASDFHPSRTMAMSLGAGALLRVREESPMTMSFGEPPAVAPSMDDDRLAEADRVDGEDGYGLASSLDRYDDGYGALSHEGEEEEEEEEMAPAADDEEEPEVQPAMAASASADYDDGYGHETYATPQQHTWPSGATAPAMLEDEESQYGDEGDIPDEAPPYQPLETRSAGQRARTLGDREQRRILDAVTALDPQADYARVVPATESAAAPADGLTFGIVPFTQASGSLGQLLAIMEERDRAACTRHFEGRFELLKTTATAATPAARLQPVDGKELWREPWLTRFRNAGAHPPFQAAQNEAAARVFLRPLVPVAHGLGLATERGLAMFVARAVKEGVAAAREWMLAAVSPIQTDAQRQQALAAIGAADLAAFQRAKRIEPTGQWNPQTHFTVLAELRRSGRSPLPLPSPDQMLDAVVRRAQGTPLGAALAALRDSTSLDDAGYAE